MKKITSSIFLFSIILLSIYPLFAQSMTVEETEASLAARKAEEDNTKDYKFVEEDILQVDVWGEPQLTNAQVQVTPDGNINVAFIGKVKAEGLSSDELALSLAKRFEDAEILVNPMVQITIIKMHQPTARVLGQVYKPGAIMFKDGDTIMDAIAQAGSYTDNALIEKTTITPKNSDVSVTIDLKRMFAGDLTQNYPLKQGDTLYIPPEDYQNKIYVFGEVIRPGIYSLKDKTTLLSAISLAGGPTDRGALKKTVVVRGGVEKPEKVECNLAQLFDKADLSQDIELMAGDTIIVPETKRPDWTTISQIIGAISNITYIRRMGLF